jgi:hypothetical protein
MTKIRKCDDCGCKVAPMASCTVHLPAYPQIMVDASTIRVCPDCADWYDANHDDSTVTRDALENPWDIPDDAPGAWIARAIRW